jgi:hypothetical protein
MGDLLLVIFGSIGKTIAFACMGFAIGNMVKFRWP